MRKRRVRGRNKSDVKEEEKVVSYADGERFAKENGLLFMETSAKTGYNVDKIFMDTASEIIRRIKSGKMALGEKDGVKVTENAASSTTKIQSGVGASPKKGCC